MTTQRKFDLHIQAPPIKLMKKYHFDYWKHIARMEGKIIYLRNGLDIYPDEGLSYSINYKAAMIYDAEYEYRKFMHFLKDKLNSSEN